MSIEVRFGQAERACEAVLVDAAAQALASLARFWREEHPGRAAALAGLAIELHLEAQNIARGRNHAQP